MTTLATARLTAAKDWPYAASAILSLVPIESEQIPHAMGVDQHWRIYHRPSLLAEMKPKEAAAVVLHEVCHLLLKHHKRARRILPGDLQKSDWERWNVASDLAVNSMLLDEGLKLPAGGLTPQLYQLGDGLAAEAYYRLLREREQEQQEKQEQSQCDSNSSPASPTESTGSTESQSNTETQSNSDSAAQASGSQDSTKSDQASKQTTSTVTSESESPGSPSSSSPRSAGQPSLEPPPGVTGGSCADGIQRPWELGEVSEEAPGIQDHEAEQIIRTVATKIEAAAKQRGVGRGSMSGWANEILHPRIDPRAKLLCAVRRAVEFTAGAGDYSYHRPNRRQSGEIIRPTSVQPIPRITVIVDTSGSMSEQDIGLSLGLIGKVLNGFRLRDGIKVVCFDYAMQSAAKVFSPKQIELAGRGGTDMGQAIKHAAESKPRPELIVVCTDGYTPYGSKIDIPVVACVTHEDQLQNVPKWIESVCLN